MIKADNFWVKSPWSAKVNRAVFIDRDGVINEERHLVWQKKDFVLLPGVIEAIKKLNNQGVPAIIIHNAAAIYRGLATPEQIDQLHKYMHRLLAEHQCYVDAVLFCGHHPTAFNSDYVKDCFWHKPKPGMILAAARKLKLDLSKSYFIGDQETDMEAGRAAGVKAVKSSDLLAAVTAIL